MRTGVIAGVAECSGEQVWIAWARGERVCDVDGRFVASASGGLRSSFADHLGPRAPRSPSPCSDNAESA